MAKLDLKKSIRGLSFFTRRLTFFGTKEVKGDQHVFDQRGAIRITDKTITKRNGEIINIRGLSEAGKGMSPGSANALMISRPSSGQFVDATRAMDSYHSWPYAAIKPIADEISGIEWRLYKTRKDGKKEEIDEHELLDFLETVNDFQTGPEFKHTLAAHLELAGNVYILLEGVKTDMDKPKAMYLLDPSRVKINLNKTTYPYKIVSYTFTIDGREFQYQPYEILQLKYPDPSNPYLGIGTVQGVAEWIDNDNNSTEFLKQFFINGAQIGVTFETDMTSEEQLQELRDSFNEQHAGVKNAYKGIFLPKGVKKPTNDVKFDDIGYDEISDSNRDKILAGFRVPKTILGAAESDTNRATAETADYVFAKRTIKPKMILICSYMNEFLVPRFGSDIYLTFTDPVPEDKITLSNEMKNAIGGAPVITVNEAREDYMNMEPIGPEGDTVLTPNTFIPLGDAGKDIYPTTLAHRKPRELKSKSITEKSDIEEVSMRSSRKSKVGYFPSRNRRAKTQFAKNVELRREISKSLTDKIADIIVGIKKKGIKDMTNDEYEEVVLKSKRDRSAKYAKEIDAELKRLNNEQMQVVLDNLPNALKSVKAVNPNDLFNLDKWINLTIEAITPIANNLFKKESDHALDLIDKPGLDVANTPSAQKAIDYAMKLMSQSYNQDTVNLLEAKLNEGLAEGYGVEKMGDLIKDIYAWKDQYAAERVALTESNRITNMAGKIAWQESGVVKELEWITAPFDVCDFCKEMKGKTIPVYDNFFNKGDTITAKDQDGEEVSMDLDYSDIGGPPLHPNCHCGMKPIVSLTIESSAAEVAESKEIDEALKDLETYE